jgi:hypothetical protein
MLIGSVIFNNYKYRSPNEVKFLLHVTLVMYDVWSKFQDFRVDRFRYMKNNKCHMLLCFYSG